MRNAFKEHVCILVCTHRYDCLGGTRIVLKCFEGSESFSLANSPRIANRSAARKSLYFLGFGIDTTAQRILRQIFRQIS